MKFHAFVIVGENKEGKYFVIESDSKGDLKLETAMGARINSNTHKLSLKFDLDYGMKVFYYPSGTTLGEVLLEELGYGADDEERDEDDDY